MRVCPTRGVCWRLGMIVGADREATPRDGARYQRTPLTSSFPHRTVIALVTVVIALHSTVATAEGPASAREHYEWRWSMYLATEVPLSVTLGGQLELPSRWRFRLGIGSVPRPYAELANSTAAALGAYDDVTAEVISAALTDSGVVDLDVAWRPLEGSGWTVSVGATALALGGSTSNEDIIAAATGTPRPEGADRAPRLYNVQSTLQLLTLDSGYEWRLGEDWALEAWGGWAFTTASNSQITFNFDAGLLQPLFELFAAHAAGALDEVYRSYVHPPIIGVRAHYVF